MYPMHTNGMDFEVVHDYIDDSVKVKVVSEDKVVIGYLASDTNCESPFKNDGMGRLYDGRSNSKSRDDFFETIGFTEEWERVEDPNPLAVALDCSEGDHEKWYIEGNGDIPRAERFEDVFAGVWAPDPSCMDHICSEARKRLLGGRVKVEYVSKSNPDGTAITRPPKPGEKPYFKDGTCIDERYSNVITWSLPDGYSQGGYETFSAAYDAAAAYLGTVFNWHELEATKRAVAIEVARSAISEYNKWLAGDCYGVCVEVQQDGKKIEDDFSCWGFIGHEYAQAEMERQVNLMVIENTPKPTEEMILAAAEGFE